MMDSGSWFAIWAICLRTSFFVMMPRSLLEKKQNRKKGSTLQYRLMPFPKHQCLFHLGTQRDNIPSFPCSWVWPNERALASSIWIDVRDAAPGCPHISSHSLLSCQSETEEPVKGSEVTGDWVRSRQIQRLGSLNDCVLQSPHLLQPTLNMTWEKNKPDTSGHWDCKLVYYSINLIWLKHTKKWETM